MSKQKKVITKLEKVVTTLANKEELKPWYRNHKLINGKYYSNCSKYHIELDWLLIISIMKMN